MKYGIFSIFVASLVVINIAASDEFETNKNVTIADIFQAKEVKIIGEIFQGRYCNDDVTRNNLRYFLPVAIFGSDGKSFRSEYLEKGSDAYEALLKRKASESEIKP